MDNLIEEIAEKLLKIAEDYKNDGNKLKVYRRYKAVKDIVSKEIRLYRFSKSSRRNQKLTEQPLTITCTGPYSRAGEPEQNQQAGGWE